MTDPIVYWSCEDDEIDVCTDPEAAIEEYIDRIEP